MQNVPTSIYGTHSEDADLISLRTAPENLVLINFARLLLSLFVSFAIVFIILLGVGFLIAHFFPHFIFDSGASSIMAFLIAQCVLSIALFAYITRNNAQFSKMKNQHIKELAGREVVLSLNGFYFSTALFVLESEVGEDKSLYKFFPWENIMTWEIVYLPGTRNRSNDYTHFITFADKSYYYLPRQPFQNSEAKLVDLLKKYVGQRLIVRDQIRTF